MGIANIMKARKAGKSGKPKPVTGNKKPVTDHRSPKRAIATGQKRATRSSSIHPWEKIAEAYKAGKSWNEISEQFKIKRTSMNGISDRLAVGVNVNGTVVKINRGKHKKAA